MMLNSPLINYRVRKDQASLVSGFIIKHGKMIEGKKSKQFTQNYTTKATKISTVMTAGFDHNKYTFCFLVLKCVLKH
jgi:hypothetical protein